MSQDEIIQAMRNLGGKELLSRDIQQEFLRIHFQPQLYPNLATMKKHNQTAFSYGLKRMVINGTVTRRLKPTHSVNYRYLQKFVYSLV